MKNTDENRKDKVIAWCITVGTMGLMLILLLACSLKTQVPRRRQRRWCMLT